MPSPKNGTACSAVSPTAPKKAEEADKADPGEMEKIKADQRRTATGKYGSTKAKPYKPSQTEDKEKSWIEISMVDEKKKPVTGLLYRITLPDGSVADGCLNEQGSARVWGIDDGTCKVTFPTLDKEAWERR